MFLIHLYPPKQDVKLIQPCRLDEWCGIGPWAGMDPQTNPAGWTAGLHHCSQSREMMYMRFWIQYGADVCCSGCSVHCSPVVDARGGTSHMLPMCQLQHPQVALRAVC